MDKIRISILTTSDYPYRGAGENFTREMALGLQCNNADVDVIRFWGDRYSNVNDTTVKCSEYLFRKPAENELLKFIEFTCQILYIPFFVIYLKIFSRTRILILFGLEQAYFVLPVNILCKIFGIKCYRIIAEIFPENDIAPYWWRKPMIFFYKIQLKYFDKYLNGIIVLSKYLKDFCLNNGVKKNRLILIPNFINLKLKSSHRKGNAIFKIGYCGIPSFENGIIDLLNAYTILQKRIPYSELIIIGKIPPKVDEKIEQLKLDTSKIIFTGLLTKSEVENEYSKCSVLVNPRKTGILADSGFPSKLGEYFSTGKPVVSTKVGDLRYYFTDRNELKFSEPDNPESLAESILFLYQNAEIAEEIGINGYKWAHANLDAVKNSRKLVDFFSET